MRIAAIFGIANSDRRPATFLFCFSALLMQICWAMRTHDNGFVVFESLLFEKLFIYMTNCTAASLSPTQSSWDVIETWYFERWFIKMRLCAKKTARKLDGKYHEKKIQRLKSHWEYLWRAEAWQNIYPSSNSKHKRTHQLSTEFSHQLK